MTEVSVSADRSGAIGRRRHRHWRGVLATTIAAAGVAAVPVVELQRARRHPKLVELDHVLDGDIGHDGATQALRLVWLGDSTAAGVGAESPRRSAGRSASGCSPGPAPACATCSPTSSRASPPSTSDPTSSS
jgi:hypothetical protein